MGTTHITFIYLSPEFFPMTSDNLLILLDHPDSFGIIVNGADFIEEMFKLQIATAILLKYKSIHVIIINAHLLPNTVMILQYIKKNGIGTAISPKAVYTDVLNDKYKIFTMDITALNNC